MTPADEKRATPQSTAATEQAELDAVLRTLRPKLRSGKFVYATLASADVGLLTRAEAMVVEDEGASVVLAQDLAEAANLGYDYVAAWITLRGATPLESVGVTASVTRKMAERGIPCNIMAGRNYDHLLVPWEMREIVVALIMDLADEADSRLLSAA